jgi:hypothetical protein
VTTVTTQGSRTRFRPSHAPTDRAGWAAVAVLVLVVLVTWAPSLSAGLGDDHEGRILARHALNIRNAQADGLAASGWLSDWSPYVGDGGEQASYAHHPPLLNLGYYLTAQLLPLPVDTAVRVFAYLLGVLALPAGAAVLRRRGLSWPATIVATTCIAVTPLFWVYGRLSGNVTLLLLMMLLIVRVAEERPIGPGERLLAATTSLAAIVAGYLGLAAAALLGLWLLARRGVDRVTVTVGVAMVLGAAITAVYVVGNTGAEQVGAQLQLRTTGGDFTLGAFLERLATWATALLPGWWRWVLLPAALVVGIADRRTRPLVVIGLLVTVGYVGGLPNGAYIHDYWILPVLLPVWFGAAALTDGLLDRLPTERRVTAAAGLTLLVVVLGGVGAGRADIVATYVTEPQAAGDLVRSTGPAPSQTTAWTTGGIAAPRWLSLYWDLPPGRVTAGTVTEAAADDLVLVRLDRVPAWLGDRAAVEASAEHLRGRYALVTAGDLAAVARAAG